MLGIVGFAAAPVLSRGQVTELTSPDPASGGGFGWAVAAIPDVDGDGLTDLAVGAPGEPELAHDRLGGEGRVHLFSGATGQLLRTLQSPSPHYHGAFGRAVAGLRDVNGDGYGDVICGAEFEGVSYEGHAYVFSGATGALLRTLSSPQPELGAYFGSAVSGIDDVDGDGIGDVVVGAYGEENYFAAEWDAGRVHLFSGATGQLLRSLRSPTPYRTQHNFGRSVASLPDVNGDARGDLLIGAPTHGDGYAYLYSGANGALLESLTTPNPGPFGGSGFGSAVSGIPDVDGDGRWDLIVGARYEDLTDDTNQNGGRGYAVSSNQGALLDTFTPPKITLASFGCAVSWVPDADGDDSADLVLGAFSYDFEGRGFVYSGTTGGLIQVHVGPRVEESPLFGYAVAGLPDMNGDKLGDLLVGAPQHGGGPWENRPGGAFISLSDCNGNKLNDLAEVTHGAVPDCNVNLVPDACDIAIRYSADCNVTSIPDECEMADLDGDGDRDLKDFAGLQNCFGRAELAVKDECVVFDIDCNGTVEPSDVPFFARSQTPPRP